MSHQSRACNACRRRKTKCVRTHAAACDLCLKRGTACSNQPPFRLPPIATLLQETADFGPLQHLLQQRVVSWGLEEHVPSLVVTFLRREGPNNPVFPMALLLELLQEHHMPEVFPLLLSSMDHSLRPSVATLTNAHRSLACLRQRDSRLLLSALAILNHPEPSWFLADATSPAFSEGMLPPRR